MMIEQVMESENLIDWSDRTDKLEFLQRRIHDDDYLHAAIQRLALILSNELMEITTEGRRNERKRRK